MKSKEGRLCNIMAKDQKSLKMKHKKTVMKIREDKEKMKKKNHDEDTEGEQEGEDEEF